MQQGQPSGLSPHGPSGLLLGFWGGKGSSRSHGASGQAWAGGCGLCSASLSPLLLTPGKVLALLRWWPRAGLPLGPFLLLNGDEEMLKGEGEGRGHMGSSQRHGGTGGRLCWRKAAEPKQGQVLGGMP